MTSNSLVMVLAAPLSPKKIKKSVIPRATNLAVAVTPLTSSVLEHTGSMTYSEVSLRVGHHKTSRKAVIQQYTVLVCQAFCHRLLKEQHPILESPASLYKSKWSTIFHWHCDKSTDPCKATVYQIKDFFVYLKEGKGLLIPAIKGYCAAFNIIPSLRGNKLPKSLVIQLLFQNFESACLPRELKPLAWDVAQVFQSLTHSPYEPLKLLSNRYLTLKMCFLLVLASAKRVNKLHN